MATITGSKKLNGWVLGAHFKDGKAEATLPVVLSTFAKLDGYKITRSKPLSLAKPAKGGDRA